MSRIGNNPVQIPAKVQISISGSTLTAKGPLGEMSYTVPEGIEFKNEDNTITFSRTSNERHVRALHGLSRSLTANMVEGVSAGFEKVLGIEGVGFKAEMRGNNLMLSLGFSHPVLFLPPEGITFETPSPNSVKVKGIDKQLVGQVAAKIRAIRPPEPYKGKGVRYQGEYIRRKAGKAAAK